MPFAVAATDEKGYRPDSIMKRLAQYANTHGTWYAQDNGDGDSWNVWVILKIDNSEYHFTWTVWQSNGFIRGVY
jgi:hypothetical protein